jgi:hypothetical protein
MSARCLISLVLALSMATAVHAANITWNAGSGTWSDVGANDANWNPADEPDPNDVAIFNTNVTVEMDTSNSIAGLTMSASSELEVGTYTLTISGPTSITASGTRVFVDGGVINSSSTIATAVLGALSGNGDVNITQNLGVATTVIDNNGAIVATNPSALIFTAPAAATLHLNANDSDARIDLDGSLDSGSVTVGRNQTLDVNLPVTDVFSGAISMAHNTRLEMSSAWLLGTNATMTITNGATGGIGAIPAGTSTIAGASFSHVGGLINVAAADGTLVFEAPFMLDGGTLTNNGLVKFDANSTIEAGSFTMPTASSSILVAANRTVSIDQVNFNMDGANAATNTITVEQGASLAVTTTDYDPDSATNAFDGTINLDNGDMSVTTGDAEFVMDGVLNMHSSLAGEIVAWTGEPFDLGNDAGALDADLNVTGDRQSQFGSQVDFNSDADVDIAAGATLALLGTTNFNTVNGGNNAQFTGAGRIVFSGGVNVNEAVTLNLVGGEVDLDGLDNVGESINIDAPLTINAATMAAFGRVNGGGGVNTLDINNNVGTGSLTVNLDNAADEWTLNAAGVMNLVNDAGGGTLLAGSDVNLNGTVNVTGGVGTTARVDVAGTINVAAASALTLQGGSLADPNRLEGGTINGPGTFAVASNRALRGFGTINPTVNYTGPSELLADDGELKLNGNVTDAGKIGTADADGVLNVVNAWNTAAIDNVVLAGGELKGGIVTVANANGIQGHGLLSAPIVNNTRVQADTGALVVETPGDNNDWDGTTNLGALRATNGRLLELRDVGSAFGFGGTVSVDPGSRVFANGFALDFNPGSSLNLTQATYQATSSTDIGGSVTVGAGTASTIEIENNFFLTFESGSATTLNADLRLLNNNINIEDNATFAGVGALVIPDGSHMVLDNQADIGVLLEMYGAFRPGNFEGIGRVNLFDYQQFDSGELYVELTGAGLNQYDRLVASGDVIVDGYLNIDIDGMFVPVLGNKFLIISGSTVTGQFDYYDVSGMPIGLAFKINYLANAVQLEVVNKPVFSADFDEDGDVDQTDFAVWRGAFDLNQLGDADGDNDSDGFDLLAWQRQFGSAPAVPVANAVPEPAACALAFSALLANLWRRRAGRAIMPQLLGCENARAAHHRCSHGIARRAGGAV